MPGHEVDWSGEFLLQKNVPWERVGELIHDRGAEADGWKDVEVENGEQKGSAVLSDAVCCNCQASEKSEVLQEAAG